MLWRLVQNVEPKTALSMFFSDIIFKVNKNYATITKLGYIAYLCYNNLIKEHKNEFRFVHFIDCNNS